MQPAMTGIAERVTALERELQKVKTAFKVGKKHHKHRGGNSKRVISRMTRCLTGLSRQVRRTGEPKRGKQDHRQDEILIFY